MENEGTSYGSFILTHQDPDSRQALRIVSELKDPHVEQDEITRLSEFPADPEERYAAILSSIANHAGKQITFLSIPNIPGTIISSGDLHRTFVHNSDGAWKTARAVQRGHAKRSLIPIGMVAEDVGYHTGFQEKSVGFTQTQAGREYGDPISKFLLKYAAENNIAFEKILGSTISKTDSRAPYNRARILEYLAKRKNDSDIRIVDIIDFLESPANVAPYALSALQDEGLVLFDSVSPDNSKMKINYSINPDFHDIPHTTHKYNLKPALEAISSLTQKGVSEFNIDAVHSEMQKKNPNSTRNVASNLVLDLARGGYLNRGEFKGGRNLSVVTILQEGEKLVTEVLEPLRIALTDTPEGKALRDKWRNIPWEEYAPKALAIHKESSNKGNSINNSTSLIKINEIILQNPGIRTTDIMKTLKESGLPHKAINMYINKLIETGKIIREKEPNNITRWYPAISS